MLENAISAFATLLRTEAENDKQKFAALPQHFKNIATEVKDIKTDYEKKQKDEKSRFNVFDTLTRHHLEELHSNFIAYLLDIHEKHDFGDTFLRFFVEIVNENLDFDDKINDFDYKNAKIYKEHSTKYGRLDIFVTTTNFNIIIENKIYANEQDEQILRYVAFAKSQHKPYIVLYLTPEGDDSATGAAGTYHAISYRNDILKWLERCLLHTKNYPIAHAGIHFYKKTLEQKILHITDNQILMDIKTLLKTNDDAKEILKHWGEIQPAVEAYGKELRVEFLKKTFDALIEKGYDFGKKPNSENIVYNTKTTVQELTTKLKLPNKKTVSFKFVRASTNWLDWGITDFQDNLDKETIEFVKKSLKNKIKFKISTSSKWIWYNLLPNGKSFFDISLHHDLATNMDELVAQFVTEVEQFLSAWRETVEELNKRQ
jgi:PD-(D/E)XK nuclease superfamily